MSKLCKPTETGRGGSVVMDVVDRLESHEFKAQNLKDQAGPLQGP